MKTKYPRKLALQAAAEICKRLEPWCERDRLKVCGSLRRGKAEVGDVEVVFVPRMVSEPLNLFERHDVSLADRELLRMVTHGILEPRPNSIGNKTWGPLNKLAVHCATQIPVDLFATTERRWWVTVVVRTGPKELNVRLVTSAQKQGMKFHAYGEFSALGKEIHCESEEDVFRIAGVPYLHPRDRK